MDNRDLQNQLHRMDQETLKNATAQASRALGADSRKVAEMLGSPEKLSRALSRLTSADMALISTAMKNPEKLNELLKEKKNADRLDQLMKD